MAHSSETRAAVLAALLCGGSVSEVARQLKLPKSTVCRFRQELSPEQLAGISPEARAKIDDLLLDLLRTNIEAMGDIATATTDPEYLRGQPLESVALLYREISATTLRMVEVVSAAGLAEEAA